MSEFHEKSRQLTPELYQRFKTALELGKWPDGSPVNREQKSVLLEAIIIYESRHLAEEERTGFIADQCRSTGEKNSDIGDEPDVDPIKWQ